MKRWIRAATLLALIVLSPAARAEPNDDSVGRWHQFSYSLAMGALIPAGEEGAGLDPGPHAGASMHYESGSGLSLGGGLEWSRSSDPLRTNLLTLGAFARLSPQDYTAAYLRLGAGAYFVSYDPESPGLAKPSTRVRPGGSFGAGIEVLQASKIGVGASVIYHGVLVQRSDAISYLTVAIDLTWRPYAF